MEKDNINILLVEDEFILAFVEKKELEKRGYVVHHVGTGEQAINFIQNNSVSIHLILMDIDLGPGLDGTKTAEKILRLKDIPIVFLSSHTEPEIVEKTEKITSYGYVVKNTGIVVLDASIKMALKLFNAKLDQLRAEESLKIFSLAVEKSSDAIGISTPDGKHYYQNKAFDLLFGEIENLPSSGLYTDKQLRGTIFDTLKSGNISSNEVKMIDKTGNIIDVMLKAYPIKDSSDKIIGLVGVHTDISENIKAEQALRESEEKLRRLIQHLHAGVVVHAPNTEIILSNDRAAEILGLTLDQMKGKSAIDPNWKFLRGDKSIMPLEEYPVNQVITKHKPIRDQVVGIYRPITDDFVWGQISAFPEFDNEGKLVQVVVTFVDITELNKAKEKIHQQLIEKEVLLKEIIHRVKNNIANIENLLVLQAETS
ncbi:MAG: PAS domain S-box protein, partial [Bacteroidetes bacterium]|nr:PAS domain S-box protein [Bacteroidota bacterium]